MFFEVAMHQSSGLVPTSEADSAAMCIRYLDFWTCSSSKLERERRPFLRAVEYSFGSVFILTQLPLSIHSPMCRSVIFWFAWGVDKS